jgi:tetratricopeptide (TPR) repeat protein
MRPLAVLLLGLTVLVAPASAQVDPGNALLEQRGWEALSAGDGRGAAEAFRQAISADPRNAVLHLGAGVAAAAEHRDADAKLALERALDLDARLLEARVVLAQVLHRTGEGASAMRHLERAVGEAPADQRLAEMLGRWRREAELDDRMQHRLNERFTVSFDGPEEATLASSALESLDRAYWRIGTALSTYPNRPISVVLYTSEQFHDITRSPAWAAGVYDGRIRVPMAGALDNPSELDRVLAHEFVHALVSTLAPRNVPMWLNEGLATSLEADSLDWARDRVAHASAPISLNTLQSSFGRLTGDQAQVAYATSALAVSRLLDEAGGFAIANLLRDLGAGGDFGEAFLHRIQRPFSGLDRVEP